MQNKFGFAFFLRICTPSLSYDIFKKLKCYNPDRFTNLNLPGGFFGKSWTLENIVDTFISKTISIRTV